MLGCVPVQVRRLCETRPLRDRREIRDVGVILGFDPGGKRSFGWCVARDGPGIPVEVLNSGICDVADQAATAAFEAVPAGEVVVCAGIDAPLVWPQLGSRRADLILRRAIRARGAPSPGGTVQEVNSLRGACLIQGVLAANAIRIRQPDLPISESHPKAMRFLLDEPLLKAMARHSEHERDAALATLSGWACIHQPPGWSDLFQQGDDGHHPIQRPVSYWMPLERETGLPVPQGEASVSTPKARAERGAAPK